MRLQAVVFDENPLMRRLLRTVFDQREDDVFTYPDPGFCPLNVADRCRCPAGTLCADIIISGLKMPDVNGLDFLQTLIGKGCRKPQFALTFEQWEEAEIERASQLDCKVFIRPLHISSIIQWLEEVEPLIAPDRKLLNWYELQCFAKAAGPGRQN